YIYITKGKSITIQNNEFTDYGRTDAKNFIAILANVENCKVISNTFDSSDNKKRVVEASWITKNPVTIENNIALYTKTPFYTVDTHNISNNATAAEGLIISKKEVYIEGLGINE
ncbi:MAG: hypothetical protein GX279_03970, partial [Clostridiaceae bacterium]|nr:hypothetical protein [Clostridiaceae bacterium]